MTEVKKWKRAYYFLIVGAIISLVFSAPPIIFWLFSISALIVAVTGFVKQITGTW